jgi:hypothetical protein
MSAELLCFLHEELNPVNLLNLLIPTCMFVCEEIGFPSQDPPVEMKVVPKIKKQIRKDKPKKSGTDS